jgi:hypothetical protein
VPAFEPEVSIGSKSRATDFTGKRTWLVRVSRPQLAALRACRDAARKFADAERDLSVPTVSAVAVGGYIPYVNTSPLPPEYEAVAANVSIPIFNGRYFPPAAKPPSGALSKPIRGSGINYNASAATCA